MFHDFAQHDPSAFRNWKASDSGANGGECDRVQSSFRCDAQCVRRRTPQRARGCCSSQLHAGRVNHKASVQFAARRDGRAADRNAADGVALPLDGFPALPPDRSGNAAAKLQIIVRGVDNGVDVHFRQVALEKYDFIADTHELISFQTGALFRNTFQRFLIVAEHNVGAAQHDRPTDQIGLGRH